MFVLQMLPDIGSIIKRLIKKTELLLIFKVYLNDEVYQLNKSLKNEKTVYKIVYSIYIK